MSKRKEIRMRTNKSYDAVCKVCGATRKNSLDFFDIAFTDKHIITICDMCNEQLFNKSLKATCYVNGRVKSDKDLAVKASRRSKLFKSEHRDL